MGKGPRFINKAVEQELDTYKKEVEEKCKSSYMYNNYVFPRREQNSIPVSTRNAVNSKTSDKSKTGRITQV